MHFSKAIRRIRRIAYIGFALAVGGLVAILTTTDPSTEQVGIMAMGLGVGLGSGCLVSTLAATAGAWRDRQASK